jgi:guanylate kinase
MVAAEEMLEHAVVHGVHKYGTPRKPVEEALNRGDSIILEIDIQGARQIKRAMPDAKVIFIKPPSWDELVARLESRGTETEEERVQRLKTAKTELEAAEEFDFVVENDEVARCAEQVVELMKA